MDAPGPGACPGTNELINPEKWEQIFDKIALYKIPEGTRFAETREKSC